MTEAGTSAGARLKGARESRGMSLQKAASELRLEPPVVEALEAGDLVRVGPTVYAKGYLRRYALLLGLPVEEILAAFGVGSAVPVSAEAGSDPGTAGPQAASTRQVLGGLAAAALLAALVWWKPWLPSEHAAPPPVAPAEPATAERAPALVPDEPAVAHTAPAAAAPVAATAPVRSAPVLSAPHAMPVSTSGAPPRTAPADTPTVAAEPAADQPGAGHARLRLSFTSDSWVEVRDAQGNKSFIGNGAANTVKSIAGQAPMHVFLRQGSGVQLEINGHTVAIGPQFFAGDVARFQAGADGVLRREAPREASAANTRPPG